jgi:L(+)-tartrate dehydratase alpha subunit
MIPLSSIQRTAEDLMAKAAIEIPDDYLDGLRRCADTEKGDLSAFVIKAMLENYEAAKEDRRAMCGDTGLPRWYVKLGNDARIEGGPVALEAALRRATARATTNVPLRPNRVHPLWRTDHNNNVGIGAPEIEYAFHPEADWIELTTVHKGGLFGSDYRMLFPGDGIEGIKRFYLDTLIGLPASRRSSASASAARRTPPWCSASRHRACASSARAIRTRKSPRSRRSSRSSATISAWAPWVLSARPW